MQTIADHSIPTTPGWLPSSGPDRTLALWTAPRRFAGFKRFVLRHFPVDEQIESALGKLGADELERIAQLLGFGEEHLAQLVAIYLGLPFRLRLEVERIDFDLLPRHFCEHQLVVPLRHQLGRPRLALGNPFRWALAHAFETRRIGIEQVDFVIVTPQEARRSLEISRRPDQRRRGSASALIAPPACKASQPLEPLRRLLFRHPLPRPAAG